MDDRAWRISSYSGGQGNCIEVVGHGNRVLVRDTKERTGPVLRFSPNAWRRFAAQVKRSLAGPQPGLQGHPCARGAPSACPGLFPARLMRGRRRGVGAVVCWIPWWPGRNGMESAVVRGARPWREEGREGRGEPGKPGLGVSRVPLAPGRPGPARNHWVWHRSWKSDRG